MFSSLNMWACGCGGIDALYLPRSSHQKQCSFLLIGLGCSTLRTQSLCLEKQRDHMEWLCVGVLSVSHSGDPS